MSNPFDALDKPDAPAAGNPFDSFDSAEDTAVRERVDRDPMFKSIVSQFARTRLDGISAEARKLPTLDSVSTLEERDRAKFVRGEIDAATAAHEEAQKAYRDVQSRGDADNLAKAMEAVDAASRRLAYAKELDQDVAGKVVRQATPQQMLLLERGISEQRQRVDYYQSLIDQGDGDENVKRNLALEKSHLIKMEAAREHARQRVADPNRPLDPSAAADVIAGIGQGMGGTFPSLMGSAAERIGQDVGNVGLTEIGRVLREYGEGNRRDSVPAPKFSDLSIGKDGFGRDLRRFLASSLGEGVGTSLPIIAGYMAGGAPVGVGASALLGIGQMQSALTDAFAEMGMELPPDKAAWHVYALGTAIGALESLTEVWGLRNLTGEVKKRAAKTIAGAMARGAAKGAVMEGLTEGLQEMIEIAGVADATGKPIDWDEARRRMVDATAAGAVPGTAFGVVSSTGQRKHAFDLALEKAAELGFETKPKTEAALPGGAPEITPPQDEPPKAPEAAAALPEPQPAGPEASAEVAAPETQPLTLPPALEPVADAIDAILPDGVSLDRQMMDKPVADIVAETTAAVTGEPLVQDAPADPVQTAPLPPEVKAQAEAIAAQPAPEQGLKQYVAEGGSLARSALPDLARRLSVTEQKLAQVMDEAVKRGELRKTAGGMYRRAPQAQPAPSMFKMADTYRKANDAIDEALAFGRQILPAGTQVDVKPGRIRDGRTGYDIDGLYDPTAGRIVLSAYAMQPKGVLAHEGVHVLVKEGHMSLAELRLLAEHSRRVGAFRPETEQAYRQAYAGNAKLGYMLDQEAAAHLIQARVNGADLGKQINSIIDRIMQVIERIANALKGKGFKTVDDVVNALVTGEMAQREPISPIGRSILPDGIRRTPTANPPPVSGVPVMSGDVLYAIRAYHGSPHDFDKFDLSKIGTGEGAQAYGHGLYFAENEGVARSYRDALGDSRFTKLTDGSSFDDANPAHQAAAYIAGTKSKAEAIAALNYDIAMSQRQNDGAHAQRLMRARGMLERGEPIPELNKGRMYEVNINANPEDFLDWDKPLSAQPQVVRDLFNERLKAGGIETRPIGKRNDGTELVDVFQRGGGSFGVFPPDKVKSVLERPADFYPHATGKDLKESLGLDENALREAGIPGIRYLDRGSRTAGEGSRNYVVFDDQLITIVAKDGVPVTAQERSEVIEAMTDAPTGDDVMYALADAATGQSMRRDLDALGYYSQALEAAKGLKQAKGTPEQMLAQIKAAGVKDAEIEATGLKGFLDGKKSVTKAEIATFLDGNRVKLTESLYGRGDKTKADMQKRLDDVPFDVVRVGSIINEDGRLSFRVRTTDAFNLGSSFRVRTTDAFNLGSLFRKDQPLAGINTIVRDLAHDVVLPIRQGILTEAAKQAKQGAKKAGVDLTSYYDPKTGVLRVTRMSDLSAVLGAVGEALVRRFDAKSQVLKGPGKSLNPLEKLLAQNSLGLVGQSGRAALWGMLPVYSGRELVPILRDTLGTYLHAWHAYKIAQGNAMMDPSAAKAAERALLNVQRQVARYSNRNLEAAIAAEQVRLAQLPPLAISPQDFKDYADLRYNQASKITPPAVTNLADPAEQRQAFAQWFRGYMLDPASTRAQDPVFYDAFEDLIDREDPTLSAKLDDSQAAIAAHAKAQPVQIIQSMIKSPERVGQMQQWFQQMDRDGLLPTLADWVRSFYRGGWDKLHPFYTAVRTLLELNEINTGQRRDLKTTENAYKLLRLAPSSHAWAGRDLEDGIKNRFTNQPEGPSLVQGLKTALGTDRASALDMSPNGAYAKFQAYLISRRALRLWDRFDAGELERPPIGASKDTARATIQTLEAEMPQFMAAAEEIYEYQRNLLKLQRDANLITPELYDELVKDADYVPFLRDMTDKPGTSKRTLSKGAQSIIKKFKGSDRDILDPIAIIAQKTYETRQLIAINDAKLMLLQLAESVGPGGGMIAERLDDQQSKAMRVDLKNALRSLAGEIGVSNADATALVHLAQQLLGDDMMATVFTKGQIKAGAEPITWVYEKGVPVPMRLADGELGKLMYDSLEQLGREHTNGLIQMMILPTQLVRGTITSNPAFILRNMFVDGLMAWMYEKTATPWLTQVGGFVRAIRETPEITDYARNAGLMGGVSTTALDKLRMDRDVDALIARGYQPKVWQSPGAWLSELARNPLRKLFEASEASETGTRARLYKIAFDRAKANGLNDVEAAHEAAYFAHDYMDYSRSGSVVGQVARIVAFMNAAMQGLDRYYRLLSAKGDYGSAWKSYIDYRLGKGQALTAREQQELSQSAHAWFVSVAVMGSMSLLITALFGDDERLKEIPEELRSTHWVIPLDGILHLVPKEMPGLREFLKPLDNQMLRLPKAFETAWFANLVERVMLEGIRGNPRWWENYKRDLWNTMHPPMEPQALQMVYELKSGKNFFSGRDIVPTWKQERLREAQWDEYTSEFSKWLGKHTDTSPYYIDHALKALGTSWARDILSVNVPGLPWYRENRPEKSLDEVMIARRFLWKAGKGSDSAQKVREIMGAEDPIRGVWSRISEPYSKLDASAETYKDYIKRRDPASASDLLDRLNPAERGYAVMDATLEGDASKYKMVHPMHRADRVLREISGLQKEILADLVEGKKKRGKLGELIPLDPSEKRAALDVLTQLQMMEAHNAMVLTGERGWEKRAYFDTDSVKAELKAAVPAVAEEFERRMKKAHVLPFGQVQQVWPRLKETIEASEFAALSKAGEKREITSRIRSLYGEAR